MFITDLFRVSKQELLALDVYCENERKKIENAVDKIKKMNAAIAVLRELNDLTDLESFVYDICESEGLGWEGPKVQRWMKAMKQVRKLLGE